MRALLKWFRYLSDAIQDGAEGFFRTQYGTISKMALLLALVILCIYMFCCTTPQQESSGLGRSSSAYITVAAFLLGALCSGIAGYAGMWVSVGPMLECQVLQEGLQERHCR